MALSTLPLLLRKNYIKSVLLIETSTRTYMEVTITDQTFSGEVLEKISILIDKDIVTVRDLIEQRVTREVERYNKETSGHFVGLVQPTESEQLVNGYKLKKKKTIDAEKQVYIALDAFKNNGFFILVDDQQADALEEAVMLTPTSTVSFVKLTPLVGG